MISKDAQKVLSCLEKISEALNNKNLEPSKKEDIIREMTGRIKMINDQYITFEPPFQPIWD